VNVALSFCSLVFLQSCLFAVLSFCSLVCEDVDVLTVMVSVQG